MGDYAKAIDYQEQGLVLARKIDDRLGEGQSLGNLGLIYYSQADYAKAINYQEQALALARKIDDRLGEGQSLGNLGIAYDASGNHTKAIEYHSATKAYGQSTSLASSDADDDENSSQSCRLGSFHPDW